MGCSFLRTKYDCPEVLPEIENGGLHQAGIARCNRFAQMPNCIFTIGPSKLDTTQNIWHDSDIVATTERNRANEIIEPVVDFYNVEISETDVLFSRKWDDYPPRHLPANFIGFTQRCEIPTVLITFGFYCEPIEDVVKQHNCE